MKCLPVLTRQEIDEFQLSVQAEAHTRKAQRELARYVTEMVHGPTALESAVRASEVLFGKEISGLSARDIQDIFADVPSSELEKSAFEGNTLTISDLLARAGVASSKGEARRLVEGGGICLNNRRVADPRQPVTIEEFIEGKVIVLRKGQKHYHLLRIMN